MVTTCTTDHCLAKELENKTQKFPFLRLLHFPSLSLSLLRFPHPLLSLSFPLSSLSRNHVIKLVGICNHVSNGRTVYATAEFVLDLNCSIVKIRPLLLRLPTNMLYPSYLPVAVQKKHVKLLHQCMQCNAAM